MFCWPLCGQQILCLLFFASVPHIGFFWGIGGLTVCVFWGGEGFVVLIKCDSGFPGHSPAALAARCGTCCRVAIEVRGYWDVYLKFHSDEFLRQVPWLFEAEARGWDLLLFTLVRFQGLSELFDIEVWGVFHSQERVLFSSALCSSVLG